MRILVYARHRRHAGGIERYLEGVIAGLVEAGHDVAMLALHEGPADRDALALPPTVPTWCEQQEPGAGTRAAVAWKPDVVFLHTLDGDEAFAALQRQAPTVFFMHDYVGACISGFKTWQSVPQPCTRPLGPGCLAHYYPHRCGGLSPVTAARDYVRQRGRQARLRQVAAVVSGARAMLAEAQREGVAAARTHFVPYYVPEVEARLRAMPDAALDPARLDPAMSRLLFVARADALKGGDRLLEALPAVAVRLGRRVHLDVCGSGPAIDDWRARAEIARERSSGAVTTAFHGWVSGEALSGIRARSSLLVVPSIWPEPFGLVGPEAGMQGLPAAAYAVGGIPEWLTDGVNGHLADGTGKLEVGALVDAIVACLEDESHWQELRRGARRLAARFRLAPHVAALERTFDLAAATRGACAR